MNKQNKKNIEKVEIGVDRGGGFGDLNMYDGEEFSRLLKEKLEKRRLEHNRK
jgi:hypothetical protein